MNTHMKEIFISVSRFVVKIPDGMALEQAAPLLCAGVTVFSPLSHFGLKQSGLRGGILGLGGVGHMGVLIAKAMGHHVTVISSSDKKRVEAMEHLGADQYLVSSDATRMQEAADSLDYIIDTVPANHPLEPYLSLLKLDGKLILTGVINTPMQFLTPMVMLGKSLYLPLSINDFININVIGNGCSVSYSVFIVLFAILYREKGNHGELHWEHEGDKGNA